MAGFAGEWNLHHQGGAAGYEPREYLGTPESIDVVQQGQAFAWNPSITGYKSEDTILVGPEVNEVVTEIRGFPSIDGHAGRTIIKRPAILEIT